MEPKEKLEQVPADPTSGIQAIPLSVTAKKSAAEVKAALDRLRKVTDASITAGCDSARRSRSSDSQMKAVRPNETDAKPDTSPDVTERFNAIRANLK